MDKRAETYEEAAIECAAALSDKDKDYIRLNLDYSAHHFGYGLYLRNHYQYLLTGFSDYERDELGAKIYFKILPIIFPEFRGYEKYIERITKTPFCELNACYNLKFGRNFIADITPEKFFVLPEYSRKEFDKATFDTWWESRQQENNTYAAAIAERLWEYDTFQETALSLGYTKSEVEEIHTFCAALLKEHHLFVPLEILFAKNAMPDSIKAMMQNEKIINWLFSKSERDVKLLPSYVFEVREIVMKMVTNNGYLLELAPKFIGDYEIVLAAVKEDPSAMEYADRSLWGERTIAEEAARHSDSCLMFSIEAFKQYNDDDDIVKLALEANGANICYASDRIRADYDMAVLALKNQRTIYPESAFKSLSKELRNRKDLAMLELRSPHPSLEGFSDELLDDNHIAMELIANEDITWMFYKMSRRIKEKYLDRLPPKIQKSIKKELKRK